jgi:hypothetical protein
VSSIRLRADLVLSDDDLDDLVTLVAERVVTQLLRDQQRRWLPVREAATELGMSEGALRKHIGRGSVKIDRVGSRILVDMKEIEGS